MKYIDLFLKWINVLLMWLTAVASTLAFIFYVFGTDTAVFGYVMITVVSMAVCEIIIIQLIRNWIGRFINREQT